MSAIADESARVPESSGHVAPSKPEVAAHAVVQQNRGRSRRVVLVVLALVVAALAARYWLVHRYLEVTDDAQIESDVVPVAARLSGTIVALHFNDNQEVHEGELLVEIDPAPAKARLAQAEAELASAKAAADAADATALLTETNARGTKKIAQASLEGAAVSVTVSADSIAEARAQMLAAKATRDKAKLELDRNKALAESGAVAPTQLESAQASFDTADAALNQANARVAMMQASTSAAQSKVTEASARLALADNIEAQVNEAKAKALAARARVGTAEALRDLAAIELSYTKIVAPRAGIVSKRSVAVGQSVSAGQSVLMLVPTDVMWVTANFKETQLARMRVGQPASIEIDAFGGREVRGVVDSFSGATGARFALLPPDNATGNFTKVVQRVPVRIRIAEQPKDIFLRPGMSVEIGVHTDHLGASN